MLRLTIAPELFDEKTNEFVEVEPVTLELEHSLTTLSKWESKFEKPFLGPEPKSRHETFEYIKLMHVGDPIPDDIFRYIDNDHVAKINDYIDSSQTATTFRNVARGPGPTETVTSELIYYWLVSFQIPFEVQHWHLNRLFALIRICNVKNSTQQKKMPRNEVAQKYRDLNARRKAELGTSG